MNERVPLIPARGRGARRTSPRRGGISPTKPRFPLTERSKDDPRTRSGSVLSIRDFTCKSPPAYSAGREISPWFRRPIQRISASRYCSRASAANSAYDAPANIATEGGSNRWRYLSHARTSRSSCRSISAKTGAGSASGRTSPSREKAARTCLKPSVPREIPRGCF